MTLRAVIVSLMMLCAAMASADDEPLDAGRLVDRVVAAAGGDAFRRLGVVELRVSEEETTTEGKSSTREYTAYVDTGNLGNIRVDVGNGVVLGSHDGFGWATRDGALDDRPQAPSLAAGAIHQRLFPLLLPFSLKMDGVRLGSEVLAGTFEGEQVYQLAISFAPRFFSSPIMSTTWHLVVRQSDNSLMTAEFLPPREYRGAQTEGVRYRLLNRADVDGAMLPKQVLLDGIDLRRSPTGHVRVAKIEPTIRGPHEPALFLQPDRLEALDRIPGIDD